MSHMMMVESNPAPDGRATNLQVMDVMLDWADKNLSKPKTQSCGETMAMAMAMAMVLRAACLQDRLRRSNISLC